MKPRILPRSLAVAGLALAACTPPAQQPPDTTLPDGVSCDGDVCTLSGAITEDFTLTADKQWLLVGGVFIGDDADPAAAPTTLTIEPGTTVYGDTATLSFLLITRGSKLVADGTAEAPIVFTSSAAEGERVRGDWGGLVLNGQAPVNGCAGDPCTLQGEAGTGTYGGADANDDSGVLRYVRVEFPGKLIDAENELNGIGLQGVGAATAIDFVQVHRGADDCIEFFGGTANAKHVVCTGIADDNLDWTFGWSGHMQFLVAQQYEDAGNNGIEADNNEDNHTLEPFSNPTISNVTLVGVPGGANSGTGVLLRRGTKGMLSNVIVTGFAAGCVDVDDAATFDNATAGSLAVDSSLFDCASPTVVDADDAFGVEAWLTETNALTDAKLEAPLNTTNPSFKPLASSPALTGAVMPTDAFFDAVTFRGAMGTEDWTQGWTALPTN